MATSQNQFRHKSSICGRLYLSVRIYCAKILVPASLVKVGLLLEFIRGAGSSPEESTNYGLSSQLYKATVNSILIVPTKTRALHVFMSKPPTT